MKSRYIRISARPISEQIAHQIDLEVLRDLRNSIPKEDKIIMELSLHQCVFGPVLIGSSQNQLCAVELGADIEDCYRNFYNKWNKSGITIEPRVNRKIAQQVLDSINTGIIDPTITLDLHTIGSYFQRKVWEALRNIQPGTTMSYKQLANTINRPNSTRAIGNACNANPIAVIIPCHRVVRSDGKNGGYKWGEDLKKKLLNREGV